MTEQLQIPQGLQDQAKKQAEDLLNPEIGKEVHEAEILKAWWFMFWSTEPGMYNTHPCILYQDHLGSY